MATESEDLLTALTEAWRGDLPEAEEILFVQLPNDKQMLALQRVRAMNQLQDGKRPVDILPEMNMSQAQLYRLIKAWRENQSLTSILPFTKPESRSKSPRIAPEVVALIENTFNEVRAAKEQITQRELVRRIRARASLDGLTPPSAETVARHVTKLALANPDLSLTKAIQPVQVAETVGPGDLFGGHLLIDHVTLDQLVEYEGGIIKPTMTLVVDDATRYILGHNISHDYPTPDGVIKAMLNTREVYQRLLADGAHAIRGYRPYLSARFPIIAGWLEVERELGRAGFQFLHMNRPPMPNHRGYGRLVSRFGIKKIGTTALLTADTWKAPMDRVSKEERANYTAVPWRSALMIAGAAVEQYNQTRLASVRAHSERDPAVVRAYRLENPEVDYLDQLLSEFHTTQLRVDPKQPG